MDKVDDSRSAALARLRDASWGYQLGLSFFIACAGWVVKLMLPASLQRTMSDALLAAVLAPLAAKALAALPALLQGALERARGPLSMSMVWRSLVSPFAALWRYQLVTLLGFVAWVRRRQPLSLPEGRQFGFIERSSYSTFAAICLISIFVDLPLNGLILSLMVRDPAARHYLHVVLAALALYTLFWLLSDRWLMRASRHVLSESALELRLGGRVQCRVPLDAIARCDPVSESWVAWCARHRVRRRAVLSVTPLDRANVLLALKPGCGVDARCFGADRTKLAYVFVYVDSPGELLGALRAGLQCENTGLSNRLESS